MPPPFSNPLRQSPPPCFPQVISAPTWKKAEDVRGKLGLPSPSLQTYPWPPALPPSPLSSTFPLFGTLFNRFPLLLV